MTGLRILHDRDVLAARVRELGAAITADHRGHPIKLLAVLKGSFVFAADLARAIDLDVRIDFLGLRSYGSATQSSGVVEITRDLTAPIAGEHVIVVEDIVDTGLTMAYLLDHLKVQRPASISVAALLHKPARTKVPVHIDYLGFTIDDVFVVGYGLDHAERHRQLPDLCIVEETP